MRLGAAYSRKWGLIDELVFAWMYSGMRKTGKGTRDDRCVELEYLVHKGWLRYEKATKSKDFNGVHWAKGPHRIWITDEGMEVLRAHPRQTVAACVMHNMSHLKMRTILPEEVDKLPEYLTHPEQLVRKAAMSKLNQLKRRKT